MIRKLTLDFIEDIEKLDIRFKSRWSQKLFSERLKTFPQLSLGVFINDELVGFVLGRKEPQSVIISKIVVSMEQEGKGIGKMLLKCFENEARYNMIESVVRSSNERSIRLHKTCGFSQDKDYFYKYSDNELGLKFFKKL